MYLTGLMKEDHIELWYPGDIVKLEAPTGAGKTTYVLTKLRDSAKSRNSNILYLCNRKILKHQLQAILGEEVGWEDNLEELYEVKDFDGITVCSYQSIQRTIAEKRFLSLDRYSYIILDEIHYILRDSLFQPEIAIFLKWLSASMSRKSQHIWMFVSATIGHTWDFLCENNNEIRNVAEKYTGHFKVREGVEAYVGRKLSNVECYRPRHLWVYQIENDYKDYEPYYYQETETLIPQMCDVKSGKWLVFMANKKTGKELKEKLVRILGEREVAYVDADIIKESHAVVDAIITNQRYEEKVLIATSILDNGVSIHDSSLRNIVMCATDQDTFLQMLGRKRKEKGEKVKVYLPIRNVKSISGEWFLKAIMNLKYAHYKEYEIRKTLLVDDEFYKFAKKFMVYDEQSCMYITNPAGIYILRYMGDFLENLKTGMKSDTYAFIRVQLKWMGKGQEVWLDRCVDTLIKNEQKEAVCNYLESMKDKKLEKPEQEKFSQKMAEWAKVPGKWKTFGKKRINDYLKKEGISYYLASETVSRKTYWVVQEAEDGAKSMDCRKEDSNRIFFE